MCTDEPLSVDRLKRKRAENQAWKEVVWFFGKMEGRVPKEGEGPAEAREAAMKIAAWFRAIPTFHAGALELRYKQRDWPEPIRAVFGPSAGIAVRIECAQHPSDRIRPTADLEEESVGRILEMLAHRRGRAELRDIARRAKSHVRSAHTAYVNARGWGLGVLPQEVVRKVALPVEALAESA
jgi:hypothetical protein